MLQWQHGLSSADEATLKNMDKYISIAYLKNNPHLVVFGCGYVSTNFTHILQGYFTGTGAILWLPQCQWSNPEGYGLTLYMNVQGTINTTKIKQNTTNLWACIKEDTVEGYCEPQGLALTWPYLPPSHPYDSHTTRHRCVDNAIMSQYWATIKPIMAILIPIWLPILLQIYSALGPNLIPLPWDQFNTKIWSY